ncbi:MAG: T9SS type A sorting domain-containing protein [bacterium]
MKKSLATIALLMLLIGTVSASWHSWAQIWGKDETHPLSAIDSLSRAQTEKLYTFANVLRMSQDFSGMQTAVTQGHAAGLKVIAQLFSNSFPADEDKQGLIDAGAEIINFEGNAYYSYGYFCCQQSAWQNYLKEAVKSAVETGADGLCLITGNNEDGRCFCSSCEANFRTYLSNNYTTAQLAALGVADINTFDYSAFLVALGYTQDDIYGDNDKSNIPLLEDYKKSNNEQYLAYINELTTIATTYGQDGLLLMFSREGPAEATTARFTSFEAFTLYTDYDVLSDIFSYQENTQAPIYKYEKAMFPSQAIITQPVDLSMGGIAANTADPEKYIYGCMAEAFANKVSYYDIWGYGLWNDTWLDWSIDSAINLKVKNYLQKYNSAFDFSSLRGYAKIAILYSTKTQLRAQWLRPATAWQSFVGLGKALSKAGFQYDVIYNGDGSQRSETISAGSLAPYEIIIISDTYALTDQEKASLLSYANNGGILLAYGEIDSGLSLSAGETSYGAGKIYYNTDSVAKLYAQTAGQTYIATIESDTNQYLSNKIIQGLPQTYVNRQVWQTTDPRRVYLHLVNHDIANTVTDLLITMEVPANFGPDELYLTSPDFAEQKLTYSQSGSSITFTVPELDVWNMLILTSTQEAHQSDERETIIISQSVGPNPTSTSSYIVYSLSEPATVLIKLYKINGELIKTLTDTYSLGNSARSTVWDLKDAAGSAVQSGVYIYQLEARGQSGKTSRSRGKIIVMR